MNLRKVTMVLLYAAPVLVAHAGDAGRAQARLIEFSAPGAATVASPACQPLCGTVAFANNDEGFVVGTYTDPNVVPHGFIRTPWGSFISFDAPGAGLGAGLDEGTLAYSINDWGAVAGQYEDPNLVFHAFIRYPNGSFVTFDAPGAGTGAFAGTVALAINIEGDTGGYYADNSGTFHGFVRSKGGPAVSFDPSGSVATFVCQETCLNDEGAAVGYYVDADGVLHGFLRMRDGIVTSIDAPGAGTAAGFGTLAASINNAGEIAGYVVDDNNVAHAFIRHADGRFGPDVNVPGAYTGAGGGTVIYGINAAGMTTGVWEDVNLTFHGFARSRDGHIARFDAPGANDGVPFAGTRPTMINAWGEVTDTGSIRST